MSIKLTTNDQVTPVVVSKALELFMIALCDKASDQARQRHSKRITAGHLKQAIIHEEQFDFLADIIEKVPDISQPTDGSTLTNGNVDSEDGNPVRKIRKPRQRKTKGEDAFLHKTGAHRMDWWFWAFASHGYRFGKICPVRGFV